MKKKWAVTLVLGILVLGGGAYWAYQHFKAEPQTASLITTTVKKGDVKKEITATGTVKYPEEVPLAFEQAGTVEEVYVQVGDTVTAGQVLAQMDTETLQQVVSESVANLKEAELNWQQQLVEAQGAIVKTKQTLRTAEQNADPAYLANQLYLAEQNVQIASNNVAKAQQSGDASSIQQAQSSLAQAQNNLITSQNAQNGGAAQTVETAKADLSIAEAKLERLAEKTSLAKAQTEVVKAQENLAKATLVASDDGVIIDVPIKKGQTINNTTTAMNLATGGDLLTVDATVSQAEIAEIKVGQKVDVTLDSAPDEHMSATVSNVALKGTTTQNVTTFNVTMKMDETNELLLAGMNVNVGIIVAEANDVLTIPSQAVRTQGSQKGVLVVQSSASPQNETQANNNKPQNSSATNRQSQAGNKSANASSNASVGAGANSNTRFVPVEIGLDDGTNVEIKSGLTEGQIIVSGTRSTSTTTNTNANINSRTGGSIPGITGGGGGFGGVPPVR
jgi:HlyD family secretion protein